MAMSDFLSKIESPRREMLSSIHKIIMDTNKKVSAEVGEMMGKEMIIYKINGAFIYGLSNVKSHMSLHMMPIYATPNLHAKYSKLLSKAKFQKGCINFKKEEEIPLSIIKDLLHDCSQIDYTAMMKQYKKNKK